MAAYQTLIVEAPERAPGVALIRLNRPEALNALNTALLAELAEALAAAEADDQVGCIVLTGSAKAFAAGADIKEMSDKTYAQMFKADFFTAGARAVERCRKPIIAAVAGYALGGGCELAMMCDMIIAADSAKFGQPEINLAVIPGAGGTQRLTHAIGKAKAMDLCLTGRFMDVNEAERAGLVSRIVPLADLMTEALKAAEQIASKSLPSLLSAKESVNRAFETTLAEGLRFERRVFSALFGTHDQKEGMAAFIEKRKPEFKNR